MTWKAPLFALFFCLRCDPGQSQEPAKAASPAIATLAENVSFTKQFEYSAPQKTEQAFAARFPRPVKVEVVQTGTISKRMEYYSDGSMNEAWKSGDMNFLVHSSAPDQIAVTSPEMGTGGGTTEAEPYFPELDWVTSDLSSKTKIRKDVKCLVYKSEDQTVWIEAETKLPVFFRSPEVQISYSFQPPPDQPLQLPEKFVQKLESVKRAWAGQKD